MNWTSNLLETHLNEMKDFEYLENTDGFRGYFGPNYGFADFANPTLFMVHFKIEKDRLVHVKIGPSMTLRFILWALVIGILGILIETFRQVRWEDTLGHGLVALGFLVCYLLVRTFSKLGIKKVYKKLMLE